MLCMLKVLYNVGCVLLLFIMISVIMTVLTISASLNFITCKAM